MRHAHFFRADIPAPQQVHFQGSPYWRQPSSGVRSPNIGRSESGMGQRSPALPQVTRQVTLSGRVTDTANDGRSERLFTAGRRLHDGWNSSTCRRVAVASLCGRLTHPIRTAAGPDISSRCGKSWSGGSRHPACQGIWRPSWQTIHSPRRPE